MHQQCSFAMFIELLRTYPADKVLNRLRYAAATGAEAVWLVVQPDGLHVLVLRREAP